MTRFRNTVVGSYPRPTQVEDTLKKPTLNQTEVDDLIRWAAKDQADLGLDVITDGEGYRENMYYFYQKRLDGVSMENMPKKTFGNAGFGIECARVIGEIKNPRCNLAHNWKIAREVAPKHIRVKQTVTGPHVLTRFSVNERPDLYPDEPSLCRAYAKVLGDELREVIAAGCDFIQFDEPMWTEAPEQSEWAAEILNELIESLPKVRVGLHVCGGNPRRKRVYFTKYTDLVPAFTKAKIDEVSLEHCTLSYDLMDLWKLWHFKGDLALGVIDQRSDAIETVDVIRKRVEPALKHFPRERLVLTSECGFGHVPLEITRAKLKALVEACGVL
ncbi:MAG TPA: cobalamin-independent methionine synthase II family protein [Verrucomicrobiae bacterium]|nr:cobalamin-independent methionine synthase II family protein [Verrucomicrobiae bacterium]